MLTLNEMQEAAKLIEVDGAEAYSTVTSRFGPEIAQVLLVAHLRRGFGSMGTYPPDPIIEDRVVAALCELKLLDRFATGAGGLRGLDSAEEEFMRKKTGNPAWGCGD